MSSTAVGCLELVHKIQAEANHLIHLQTSADSAKSAPNAEWADPLQQNQTQRSTPIGFKCDQHGQDAVHKLTSSILSIDGVKELLPK